MAGCHILEAVNEKWYELKQMQGQPSISTDVTNIT